MTMFKLINSASNAKWKVSTNTDLCIYQKWDKVYRRSTRPLSTAQSQIYINIPHHIFFYRGDQDVTLPGNFVTTPFRCIKWTKVTDYSYIYYVYAGRYCITPLKLLCWWSVPSKCPYISIFGVFELIISIMNFVYASEGCYSLIFIHSRLSAWFEFYQIRKSLYIIHRFNL